MWLGDGDGVWDTEYTLNTIGDTVTVEVYLVADTPDSTMDFSTILS